MAEPFHWATARMAMTRSCLSWLHCSRMPAKAAASMRCLKRFRALPSMAFFPVLCWAYQCMLVKACMHNGLWLSKPKYLGVQNCLLDMKLLAFYAAGSGGHIACG